MHNRNLFLYFPLIFHKKEKTDQRLIFAIHRSFFGPSDRSRTCGLLNPIQARYQAALHPELPLILYMILLKKASKI